MPQSSQLLSSEHLPRMLFPYSVDEFLTQYAGRQALLIKGQAEKFAFLGFDLEAFFASAEQFDAAADRLKVAIKSPDEQERYRPAEPDQARQLYREGYTVCAAGLSDQHEGLSAFAESIRRALSIQDLRFNSYLSPDGSGFNLHYDAQPIFLIQISGKKQWWYGSQAIQPTPKKYSIAWDNKPSLDELEQTVLEPGDVLYLPAFTWHRARAIGHSLGITLGVKGTHNRIIRSALEVSPIFQDWPLDAVQPPLTPACYDADNLPSEVLDYIERQRELMKEHIESISTQQLWQAWVDDVQAPKGPTHSRVEVDVFSNDRFERTDGFPVYLDFQTKPDGKRVLRIRYLGHRVLLERDTKPLVEWIVNTDSPFGLQQACEVASTHGLTRSETKRLCRELAAIGLLNVVAENLV